MCLRPTLPQKSVARSQDELKSRRPSRESARDQWSTVGSELREKSRHRPTAPPTPALGGITGRKVGSSTGRGDRPASYRWGRPPLQTKNPRSWGGWRRRKRRRKAGAEETRRQRRQTRAAERARSAGEGRRRRISSRSASSSLAVASPSLSGGAGLRHSPRIWVQMEGLKQATMLCKERRRLPTGRPRKRGGRPEEKWWLLKWEAAARRCGGRGGPVYRDWEGVTETRANAMWVAGNGLVFGSQRTVWTWTCGLSVNYPMGRRDTCYLFR